MGEQLMSTDLILTEETVLLHEAAVSHSQVLSLLLDQLHPIDFKQIVLQDSLKSLTRKHYLIIANEHLIDIANKQKWALCIKDSAIYVYNGAYWERNSEAELKYFLGKASERLGVDKYDAKFHKFQDEMFKQFMCSAHLPKQVRDNDEVIINLKNGTFHITPQDQLLKDFDKDDFLTYQLPFAFDEEAEAPQFTKYLNRVIPDVSQQQILAEFIGHVFVRTSSLKLEKALILFGGGANGKSVFFEIINALLGSENITSYGLQSLTNENGYYRAMIGNKLLNYTSEISNNINSSVFKQLVSGEPIECRLPHGVPFIIKDYAKLMFNANELPKDVENTEAFFRRFLLLDFNVTIPEHERDPELAKRIISHELPGIFNWVLDGLNRLLHNKRFTHSAAADNLVRTFRQDSDTLHLFMEDYGYVSDNFEEIPLKVLYNEYKSFCLDSGYKVLALKSYSDSLRKLGIRVHRKSGGNVVDVKKKSFEMPAFATLCTSNIILN
jgi:putative DNA primase/helicase